MKQKAFTLIELLVVIVIIGILATITTATFSNSKEKAVNVKIMATIYEYKRLLESYHVYSGETYKEILGIDPSTLLPNGICPGNAGDHCIGAPEGSPGPCDWVGRQAPINTTLNEKLKKIGNIPEFPKGSPLSIAVVICNGHNANVRLQWFLSGIDKDCIINNETTLGGDSSNKNLHPNWSIGTLCGIDLGP